MTDVLTPAPAATQAAFDPDAPDALWAVGAAETADGLIDYPVSNRDMVADTRWAGERLQAMGVARGALLDFVHNYRECGQFWPYYMAAAAMGAPVMNGMATPWDVGRTEMYTRRFDLALVMGIGGATTEGLRSFGHDSARVFAKVPLLIAREPAASELEAAGLTAWRLTLLGPLLLTAAPGEGAPYDTSQWTVEADGEGRLRVSSGSDRAARYARLDTGLRGRVENGRVFIDAAA
ncbi:hypothetical protein [Brevundimonas sp.]|jgi:hypothetical protein|uniref:hypothetical protein n=1 Tax=Brevundimonas sp. TaxID=1871086 RepID=UPI003782D68B